LKRRGDDSVRQFNQKFNETKAAIVARERFRTGGGNSKGTLVCRSKHTRIVDKPYTMPCD